MHWFVHSNNFGPHSWLTLDFSILNCLLSHLNSKIKSLLIPYFGNLLAAIENVKVKSVWYSLNARATWNCYLKRMLIEIPYGKEIGEQSKRVFYSKSLNVTAMHFKKIFFRIYDIFFFSISSLKKKGRVDIPLNCKKKQRSIFYTLDHFKTFFYDESKSLAVSATFFTWKEIAKILPILART